MRTRIEEVRSIALPSVLECLQEGFASPDARKLLPETTLTQGFSKEAKEDWFTMIKHQHRMNKETSEFSRNEFYDGEALKDANTIEERNKKYPFEYRKGREKISMVGCCINNQFWRQHKRDYSNQRNFARFYRLGSSKSSSKNNDNRDDKQRWEVALLSPYQAQRRGLRDMVQSLTGMQFETRFDLLRMKTHQMS